MKYPSYLVSGTRFAGLFLSVAFVFSGCGKRQEHNAPRPDLPVAQVGVARAESERQVIHEEVVGTVRAKVRATLEAKVSGRIQELPVRLGQAVKARDLVARLDASEIQARREQALAGLQQAERDWRRVESLFKSQAVTQSEFDSAESGFRVAKATAAEAEAMLAYTEVLAPFDGVVSRQWTDVGDFASPGKPLVDIEDPSSLQLEADVPESLAAHVSVGASLAVRLDGLETPVEGKVAEMAPSANPASRTVRIKVDLAQAPGLIPGRFARVLVPIGEGTNVAVPSSAVVHRGQLEMVFVITNRQAQLRLVKTGKMVGDQVSILAGLDPGDIVAVDGANLLVDGQPVQVK